MLAGSLAVCLSAGAARAFDIVLKDVAPDRVERQRAFYFGQTVLPGTPDVGRLDERLAAKGVAAGAAVMVRIFKVESELELWMRSGDRFILFDTYPICHWSGTIGPKFREGDKQAPEGFYTVALKQTRLVGQWRRAFNVGFPNPLDQLLARTGSNILVHGGCSSVGCFAMTNPVMDEIFRLTQAALKGGQDRVHVHIFPFRMTAENLEQHKESPWYEGWQDLKAGHDLFESMGVPPNVAICDRRYIVRDGRLSRPDAAPFQVVTPRAGSGTAASRCSAEDLPRVASADGSATSAADAGPATSTSGIVTGSITPRPARSEPAAATAAIVGLPPTATPRAVSVDLPAAPAAGVRLVAAPIPASHAKSGDGRGSSTGGTTGAPPGSPRGAPSSPPSTAKGPATGVPAASAGAAASRAAAHSRKRLRSRTRTTTASSDLNDRPEFIAVRRSSP